MKKISLAAFVLVAFGYVIVFSNLSHAQIAPLCGSDPTCTPDRGSSYYSGAVAARTRMLNARGHSSPIVPVAQHDATTTSNDVTVIGSQSYSYAIPVLRLPGRAGMDFVLNLYYNSRIWDVDTVNGTITFNADRDFPSYGFRLDYGFLENTSSSYILTEGDGTKRNLAQGTDPAKPYMYYSTDGSHVQLNSSTGVLSYKNGRSIQYQPFPSNSSLLRPISVKDSNGNYFGITYVSGHDQLINNISDSLGRVISLNYDSANRLTSLSQMIHPSGSKTHISFTWGNPYGTGYVWYNFSGFTVNGAPTPDQVKVITGCTYPNGTGYRFTYGDWGIINKIESLSSTGLTRSYTTYDFPLASQGALTDAPAYTHETVSPDGGTSNNSVWTYTTTKNGTGIVTSMAVADPQGTTYVTNLDPNTGLISSRQIKDGSGTLLRKDDYTWTTAGSPPVSTVLDNILTTLSDTAQQSKVAYGYDPWANVTDVYEYDFGLALKRHTVTSYLTTGDYVTFHVVNLPTQILVQDGSGNTVVRTDLAYDGNTLKSITGAANHDDAAFPATFSTRGNLTSVTRYVNAAAGTGGVTRNFYYDSLGNLITAQLDCCNQKTFTFSSTTQYSFPESITRGPSGGPLFTINYTYDPDSSLPLTIIDENNQITQYQYDSMGRTRQVILPPQNGTSLTMNTAYGDDTVSPTVTASNTANSAISVATLDGLGHLMQTDSKNATTVVSSIKYVYDQLWQPTKISNPYSPSDTIVYTTYSYDALSRVTQIAPPSAGYNQYSYSGNTVTITDPAGKQRKNYTDALGRLVEVDEPGETFSGSRASGSLTINGALQSHALTGTSATGSATVSGSTDSVFYTDPCTDAGQIPGCPTPVYDYGSVYLTVNGHTDSAFYGQSSTPTSIANDLASAINSDGGAYVNATASNGTVYMTARQVGAVGNYSWTIYAASGDTTDPFDPNGSFANPPSSGALSGGTDGQLTYDSGTVTVTIGSFTATAPYSQTGNSTAPQVASALVSTGPTGLNRSGSPVSATASGGTISLIYNTVGNAGNLPVAATSASNNASLFPSGSFSGSSALSGGEDSYSAGLAHPYATTYTYDVLDDLTGVSQAAGNVNGQPVAGQLRSYVYDGLGRLTSSTTAESGTVTTYYTTSSGAACSSDPLLACRLQDARGIVRTFTYDGINRTTGISYSDGTPTVTYQYDTGGAGAFALYRRTKIIEGANSQTFTYDSFGRITSVSQIIDGTTYLVQYGFNLAGQLTSITYPSKRVVTQNVDAIGRPSSISDSFSTYLSNLSYNAAGETLALTLGNSVKGSFSYNDHLQLASLRYFTASADILKLSYDYTTTSNPNNNGQVQVMHYFASGTEDLTKSENFSYDPLGRLSAANTSTVNSTSGSKTWSLQWSYDRFGNRKNQTLIAGDPTLTIGQPNFSFDSNTNRITNSGFQYDAAGNITNDGTNSYTYDGANRLTRINAGPPTYTYFGALRIKKVVGSTATVSVYSGSRPIAEYVNGSLSKEYIYAGTQLLATVSGGSTTYHHPDHLSNRAETDSSGKIVRTFGHFPFGETWYETGTADKWKFTGYENDSGTGETGLNYAIFRYHSAGQGRFLTVDPLGGDLRNPQSLNRYPYSFNDPVNITDPSGMGFCTGWDIYIVTVDPEGNIVPGSAVWVGFLVDECFGDEGHGDPPPPVDGGGGGGGTDTTQPQIQCTFVIRLNNNAKLTANQIARIQEKIADLLAPGGLGVKFVDSGKADAKLKISNTGFFEGLLNAVLPFTKDEGHTGPLGAGSVVHPNRVKSAYPSESNTLQLADIMGAVGAHELFHNLTGAGHTPNDPTNPESELDIMRKGNEHDDRDLKFTSDELKKLLDNCLKRHPK